MFSDGAWQGTVADARFLPWPRELDAERLTQLFRRLVLRTLVRRKRLSESTAERLLGWEHSGFSVFLGDPITPWNHESRQRLARYLVKAPLSLERIQYEEATSTVVYGAGKGGQRRELGALDFLAEISVAVPNRGQHLVSPWGRHSNRARGVRRKALAALADGSPAAVGGASPAGDESDPGLVQKRKALRMAWAALLRKVWNVDALACPRCASAMKVVAAITEPAVIERILKHRGLFDRPRAPSVHVCPSPPTGRHDQTLLAFPPTTSRGQSPLPQAACPATEDQNWPVDPTFADTTDGQDAQLEEWAVDPPFAED